MPPESPDALPLVAPVLVAWGNAWLSGHTGLDEAADRVEAVAGPTVANLPDDPNAEVTLRAFLAGLRSDGLTELRLALPAPGDPLGLSGPPSFNAAAVDAGQAAIAVLTAGPLGLVPALDLRGSSYVGVRLVVHESRPPRADLPSVAEAERDLSIAMQSATEALASVEGPAQERPDRLERLDRLGGELAPGYPGRAHRVCVPAT
ncbi:hypothetical protein, partial [Nonomuraea rhizosphaerae]|uniref:hypothetical protein n=1 Tax=Nonomuraea rhizosphaerae TaxID=2665663 RepID=UPI001C5E1F1D